MDRQLPPDSHMRLCAAAMAAILRDPKAASLASVASAFGMPEAAARRAFMDCAGISPKRFAQFACAGRGADLLADGACALEASLGAGGTSAGFLHAVSCSALALSPGEAGSGGEGLRIGTGSFETLLGPAFCARSERGVVALEFLGEGPGALARAGERARGMLPNAKFEPEPDGAFDDIRLALAPGREPARIHLLLSGTNFQIKAWSAALGIPCGASSSYAGIAAACGSPLAARAAGSAMAANRIAMLVPCHRALRADGSGGGYRWGAWRKAALLALEKASRPA